MKKGGSSIKKGSTSSKKRPAPSSEIKHASAVKKRKPFSGKGKEKVNLNFDVSSDEENDNEEGGKGEDNEIDVSSDDEEEIVETPDEKRFRLTKEYLSHLGGKSETKKISINTEEDEEEDDYLNGDDESLLVSENEEDGDRVGDILHREALDKAGKLHNVVAKSLKGSNLSEGHRIMKGHKAAVTAIALSSDDRTAHSGSKDASIIQWDVETGKKVFTYKRDDNGSGTRHTDEILTLAINSEGTLLASGGKDKLLRVWDVRTNKMVQAFKGHRDSLSCLSFRRNSNDLYSGSHDRSLKVWNLNEMAYVDSLYGHQSEINSIDSFYKEGSVVTVSCDRTARNWNIVDESHLVFRSSDESQSLDCVKIINDEYFISGAQNGSISLWSNMKKKPIYTELKAHAEHWISSLSCLPGSDLIASGAGDGFIRFWEVNIKNRHLNPVSQAPVCGFVNGLAFAKSGKFVLAGVGQEQRLGRWWINKEARNGLELINLPLNI